MPQRYRVSALHERTDYVFPFRPYVFVGVLQKMTITAKDHHVSRVLVPKVPVVQVVNVHFSFSGPASLAFPAAFSEDEFAEVRPAARGQIDFVGRENDTLLAAPSFRLYPASFF